MQYFEESELKSESFSLSFILFCKFTLPKLFIGSASYAKRSAILRIYFNCSCQMP